MRAPIIGRMLHDEEGRLKLIPYGNKPHEVIYSVSRAGLNAVLLDAAESTGRVSVRFEETVREVDFEKRRGEALRSRACGRVSPWPGNPRPGNNRGRLFMPQY